ncbi:MAG: ferritin family protein [Spirochaetes bacterium]|nr:ferritin family protein [Spirochaetota bacterium]
MIVPVENILMMAIQIEKSGIEFYRDLQQKFSPHSEVYKILGLLWKDEMKHKQSFEKLLATLKVEKMKTFYPKEVSRVTSFIEKKLFGDIEKAREYLEKYTEKQDMAEVFLYAIGIEMDTVYLYEKISAKIIPAEKDFMNAIIYEERSHVNKLKDLRAKIKSGEY